MHRCGEFQLINRVVIHCLTWYGVDEEPVAAEAREDAGVGAVILFDGDDFPAGEFEQGSQFAQIELVEMGQVFHREQMLEFVKQ